MSIQRIFPFLITRRTLILMFSDCIAFFGTAIFVGLVRGLFDPLDFSQYYVLLPFLVVGIFVNYIEGLYDPIPPTLPEEVKSLIFSTSLAYFCIAIYIYFFRADLPSRLVYLGSWIVSLGIVPIIRYHVRGYFSKKPWWGIPTIFFGYGSIVTQIEAYLLEHPEFGLMPVGSVALSHNKDFQDVYPKSIDDSKYHTFFTEAELEVFLKERPETCALVILSRNRFCYAEIDHTTKMLFSSVILVPEDFLNCKIPLWVRPLEVGSMLWLRVRQNLLDPRRLFMKRCIDLILSSVISISMLPIFIGIASMIYMESPGPVFFRQKRIGRNGKIIKIIKFRTMVHNAEYVLQKTLSEDEALRKEWNADQKLRYDPRITKIGKFLRKTSLDELPQVWNVLCGDMSMVGPRPIVQEEGVRYGETFPLYLHVRPGITGLWQVSGRNDLTYNERVQIDWYYISNWSIVLDILILAKTIPVIFTRKGAY